MSDFEAKHPRAKDGKFTEKKRKESGLTLEPDKKCSDTGSPKLPPQGIFSDSGNSNPSTDVDGLQTEPEQPMGTSFERASIRTPWGIIKHPAQLLTFIVFAVILLALCIGVWFFFVETDSNKNEPQVPEGTKTAAGTIAADPSQTPAPALEQVKPGTALTESVTDAVFLAGNSEQSSYSDRKTVERIASVEVLISAIGGY